jgi:sugar lactone lactonase YvrE
MSGVILLPMNSSLLRRLFLAVGGFATALLPIHLQAAAGELYESDLDSSSIARFTAKGTRSTVTTGIFDLFGVAFNSKAELFAASDMGNTIYKVAANGTKTVFTSAVNGPFALAFDRFDNLFACNFRTGQIVRITPNKVVTPFASGLHGPVGLAFNSAGFLFVSSQSDGTVLRYAPNGAVSIFASGLVRPTGLAFDAAGNLFVTERLAGRIAKLTPNGTKTTFAFGLREPFGAAMDGEGNLFVADHSQQAIFKYAPNGTRSTFATGLHLPTFLSVEPPTGSILNISTRAKVLTGDDVLIGGFIVAGPGQKNVALRGIGPSLARAGIAGALADPTLELRNHAGALVAMNDNWKGTQQAAIVNSGLAPRDDRESAILATLAPGAYSVIERGNNDTTGVGLVELYDLAQTAPAKLGNISTRALVGTGTDVVIAGFILGNGNGVKVLVRGLGPSLRQSGITNALANPTLELRDHSGQLVLANDNWKSTQATAIQATRIEPANDLESAIVTTLPAGSYTAILQGNNGGTGVGLVEVYAIR